MTFPLSPLPNASMRLLTMLDTRLLKLVASLGLVLMGLWRGCLTAVDAAVAAMTLRRREGNPWSPLDSSSVDGIAPDASASPGEGRLLPVRVPVRSDQHDPGRPDGQCM